MAFPPTDWLDWTTAEYDVGAPATSLSFERWFRNPVGLAQGAVGAPRIEFAAMSGWYTTPGGVGTYVFAYASDGIDRGYGDTIAGSLLHPCSAARSALFGSADGEISFGLLGGIAGTWICMGYFDALAQGSWSGGGSPAVALIRGATLWQRIA